MSLTAHVINITFSKVTLSANLSSVSINISVLLKVYMLIIVLNIV